MQKDIYNVVLEAQNVTIDAMHVGASETDVNNAVKSYFAKSLKMLNLIKDDSEVDKYYYHGIGHPLGLDVHDFRRRDKTMQENNVYTVEPGLYIKEEGLGIRIEDNVWVTKNGIVNLSKDIIKTVNLLPLRDISPQGKMSLGLTLMTVVFWAFYIVQSGYTSGLGERIAYAFIMKFVNSYKSIIYSVFILTFILSIIIPHSWPRAFIIMSIMDVVSLFKNKESKNIELSLPKFESSYEDSLKNELSSLGMNIAFEPNNADFSLMREDLLKDLYISEVRQKTYIKVDEKGTEAAAVTSVAPETTSMPVELPRVVFDRPFVYGIVDVTTGIPLFIGIMENPTTK